MIEDLLSRLEGRGYVPKRAGEGRWISRCPAHDDRDPSLSVRVKADGRVLIKCHAGCTATAVIAALDLSMSDLFGDKPLYHYSRGFLVQSEERAYHEAVVEICAADLRAGKRFTREDIDRLKSSRAYLLNHPVEANLR